MTVGVANLAIPSTGADSSNRNSIAGILAAMRSSKRLLCVSLLLASLVSCSITPKKSVTGDLMVWHKITVSIAGPETSEDAEPNPFRDYRLNITFTHDESGTSYTVPGFFAADGDASNTSATAGSRVSR